MTLSLSSSAEPLTSKRGLWMASKSDEEVGTKESTTEPGGSSASSDGGGERSTRSWMAVAFAFLATLSVAAILVTWQFRTRQEELRNQFAMTAARLGRAIELKYESTREVVDNVTGVLRLAQVDAGTGSADLTRAQAKLDLYKKVQGSATELLDAATARKKAAEQGKEAGATKETVAWKEAFGKVDACVTKAQESERAQDEVKIAAGEVSNVQHQRDLALAVRRARSAELTSDPQAGASPPPATPAPATQASSEPATDVTVPIGATTAEIDAIIATLEKRVIELKATLDQKNTAAADSDKASKEICAQAGQAQAAVAATEESNTAKKEVDSAKTDQEKANIGLVAANSRLLDARRDFEVRAKEVGDPSNLLATAMARHVPPSYAAEIDACASNPAGMELCVARTIADINGWTRALVRCEPAAHAKVRGPTLADGGEAVLIPSSDPGEHAICAKVGLDELVSLKKSTQARLVALEAGDDSSFDEIVLLDTSGNFLRRVGGESESRLVITKFPKFTAEQGRASSILENVAIGAGKYRVFFQPVRISLTNAATDGAATGTGERHDVVVAGLVREVRLAGAATQISLGSYLWFVLLLAFGLLCLPLAKLWFLGTRSSFGRFDVTLLGASGVLITLLAVVLTLGFVAHNRLAVRHDEQLGKVATMLDERLSSFVLNRALDLQTFVREEQQPCEASDVRLNTFHGESTAQPVCEHARVQSANLKDSRIFLTDRDGRQTTKYTDRPHATTPLSVGFRNYFQLAKAGEPVCVANGGCELPAVPEVVRSATSGKFVLVVAAALRKLLEANENPASGDERSEFAALEADLKLDQLVLPMGFQAAVIESDGTVMLHTDSDARFGQQFFDDVDNDEGVRSVVAGGQPETMNLRYLGVPSRARILPLNLDGARWFAVVIAPRSITDLAAVNMGITTLLGFGAVVLLVLVVGLLIMVATRTLPWLFGRNTGKNRVEQPRASLQPDARLRAEYARVGLLSIRITAVLGIVSLACYHCSALWLLLAVLAGFGALLWLPGVGIQGPLAPIRLAIRRRLLEPRLLPDGSQRNLKSDQLRARVRAYLDAERWEPATLTVGYPLAIAGLVGILVIAPATAIFAGAYDYGAENMVRAEQRHYLEALRSRPNCLRATQQLPECQDVVRPDDGPAPGNAAASLRSELLALLLDPIPFLASQIPALGPEASARGARANLTGTLESIAHFARHSRHVLLKDREGTTLLSTEVPTLLCSQYSLGHLWWTVLAFSAFLGFGWVTSASTLKRLFFLKELDEPKRMPRATAESLLTVAAGESRFVLVLRPSTELREAVASAANAVDLTTLGQDALNRQPAGQVLYVPELEGLLEQAETAALITRAQRRANRLIVFSNADPLRRAPRKLQDLWSSTLQPFEEQEGGELAAKAGVQPTTATMTLWWRRCDADERRVLSQLVVDGYTNPHAANIPAIRSLVGRGLLCPSRLTIIDPHFADFIRQATSPADLRSWEDAGKGTIWHNIRVPLGTGVVALLTALAASKPELGIAGALVPLATVSLPSLLKILVATIARQGVN